MSNERTGGYRSPEELEAEADADLIALGLMPPADPDSATTEKPKKDEVTDKEPVTEPAKKPADAATETASAEPGEGKSKTPATADSGEDLTGLTPAQMQERVSNAQARMTRATMDAADLRKKNDVLENRCKTFESEVARLQQEFDALKTKPPESKQPESAPGDEAASKAYESLEALRKDYGVFIDPLLARDTFLTKKLEALEAKVGKVDTDNKERIQSDAKAAKDEALEKHYATIYKAHKDADAIVQSADFQGWLDRQPPMVRRAIDNDGTANDVIKILTDYKAAVGIAEEALVEEARQVETPGTPKRREAPQKQTKPTFTRKQIDEMPMDEFNRREAEIDEALAEGRVT